MSFFVKEIRIRNFFREKATLASTPPEKKLQHFVVIQHNNKYSEKKLDEGEKLVDTFEQKKVLLLSFCPE